MSLAARSCHHFVDMETISAIFFCAIQRAISRREGHFKVGLAVDGGHLMLRLTMEAKVLPSSVVKRRTEERVEKIEDTTGRKLSRMEKKDLREETLLDLLPKAFTRISNTTVWIDQAARLWVMEVAGQTKADDVVAMLLRSLDGLVTRKCKPPARRARKWPHGF